MADLIDDLRRQMQERLKEIGRELTSVQALIDEKARIERALATEPFAQPARREAVKQRGAGRRTRPRSKDTKERLLTFIGERPGVSVTEVATGVGVNKGYVYNLVAKMAKEGLVERIELPGGGKGVRRKAESDGASSASKPDGSRRASRASKATEAEAVAATESSDGASPDAA